MVTYIITLLELKEEMARGSQCSFNISTLSLDPDDEFMGFDSVTVSKSVIFDY